jgi:phenylpropionate dioxygenase-like ring-hydroxylating dioxygenase large terminal subunit
MFMGYLSVQLSHSMLLHQFLYLSLFFFPCVFYPESMFLLSHYLILLLWQKGNGSRWKLIWGGTVRIREEVPSGYIVWLYGKKTIFNNRIKIKIEYIYILKNKQEKYNVIFKNITPFNIIMRAHMCANTHRHTHTHNWD